MTDHIPLHNWTVGFVVYRDENHRPGTGLWKSARVNTWEGHWSLPSYSTLGDGTLEAAVQRVLEFYPNHAVVVQMDTDWYPSDEECQHRPPLKPCAWFDDIMVQQMAGCQEANERQRQRQEAREVQWKAEAASREAVKESEKERFRTLRKQRAAEDRAKGLREGTDPDHEGWWSGLGFLMTPRRCHLCQAEQAIDDTKAALEAHLAKCPVCLENRTAERRTLCPERYELQRAVDTAIRREYETDHQHHCVPHKCSFGPNCMECLSMDEPDKTPIEGRGSRSLGSEGTG